MADIQWLSEHDETRLTGESGRYKIGLPKPEFWTAYDADPEPYKMRGWEVVTTSSGRFIKVPAGILVEPPTAKIPCPKPPRFLRDFQGPHFKALWDVYGHQTAAGDFSDTGTGKTYVTLALALEMNLPVFVVCMLAGMDKWIKLIKHFGVKCVSVGNYEYFKTENEFGEMQAVYSAFRVFDAVTQEVAAGGKIVHKFCPFPKTKVFADYKECLAYIQKRTYVRPVQLENWEKKTGKSLRLFARDIRGYKWNLPRGTFMVFDEAHKCKSEDSQNARLLAASKPYVTEVLTATPGVTPRDFRSMGYALGLHNLYDFDLWTEKHGCRRVFTQGKTKKFIGWDYAKKSGGLEALNLELFPLRASRMRISEIPGFPKTVITAESFTAKEAPELQKVYAAFTRDCKAAIEAKKMLPVTSVLRYRMLMERLKVPLYLSQIEEAHEAGFSVAMFVNFTETLELLAKKLPDAPKIHGGQKKAERERGRLRFENNEVKTILLNIQAGGASLDLHDIHGGHPRMALISPTYNPYDLKQVFGRVNRDGGKSTSFQRIVFMAGTQEEKVCEKVKLKLKAFETVNGDVTEKDLIEDVALGAFDLAEFETQMEGSENEG